MVAVLVAGGVLGLLLVVWFGTRMLRSGEMGGTGASDMFANFIDVFDPSRARADQDILADKHKGEIAPSPDPLDRPLRLDLHTGRATVRRPPSDPPAA